MIRNLLIITGVGLVLAVVGIGGALALGGRDLARHEWTWVVTDDRAGDSDFRFQRGRVGPDVTRTLAWEGAERLSVDMPAEVAFVQGAEAGVRITGPQAAPPPPPMNLPAGLVERVQRMPAEGAAAFDPTKPETDHQLQQALQLLRGMAAAPNPQRRAAR